MRLKCALVLLVFLQISACQPLQPFNSQKNKNLNADVIYGEDDRRDWYDESDSTWQQLAQSTVALFDKGKLQPTLDGEFRIDSVPYGVSLRLCEDEAFFEQPRASFCSGFLVGPDVVVTAGHCLRNSFNCEDVRFVFGYRMQQAGLYPETLSPKNIFSCKEIIHTQANAITGSDFAIARLDRPVVQASPLMLRTTGGLESNASLTVIGYPSGLPLKIAHGGLLRNNDPAAFFVASLDTYGGNSGSAVFNSETRLVEGILFNGDTDFVFDTEKGCRISNRCQQSSCRGEDVTRISEIFPYLTPQDF